MKVVELTQRFPPAWGGVEVTLGELVPRLVSAGIEVEVITTDLERSRPFTRRAFQDPPEGVPVRRCRAVRTLPLPLGLGVVAPGMLVAAAASRADVLHAHAFGQWPTWVGAALRRLRRTPLVVTTHADPGRGLTFSALYHRAVVRATLRRADRVIVQSGREAAFLRSAGVPPGRLVRIPTGIALEEYDRPPRAPASARVRVLSVGRLDPEQKDLAGLLTAFAALPPSRPVELRIIGDDWGGAALLREMAGRLGIGGRVEVRTGVPRAELLRAYREADLFVLASRFDSFPRVLLEAMAAGLAIVASRVGGVEEIVRHGENGLLVSPGDARGLAESIGALASDEGLRARFGSVSRQRAEAYDWKRLIPAYRALFEELAAAKGPVRAGG